MAVAIPVVIAVAEVAAEVVVVAGAAVVVLVVVTVGLSPVKVAAESTVKMVAVDDLGGAGDESSTVLAERRSSRAALIKGAEIELIRRTCLASLSHCLLPLSLATPSPAVVDCASFCSPLVPLIVVIVIAPPSSDLFSSDPPEIIGSAR